MLYSVLFDDLSTAFDGSIENALFSDSFNAVLTYRILCNVCAVALITCLIIEPTTDRLVRAEQSLNTDEIAVIWDRFSG